MPRPPPHPPTQDEEAAESAAGGKVRGAMAKVVHLGQKLKGTSADDSSADESGENNKVIGMGIL